MRRPDGKPLADAQAATTYPMTGGKQPAAIGPHRQRRTPGQPVRHCCTWCGPCIAEIPELKAVHDRFGKDARFAMLSLSLDAEKEAPRKSVAEKRLPWP